MAHTDHTRMTRNPNKRAGNNKRVRAQLQRELAIGDWDSLPTHLPTRALRTSDSGR